MYKDMFKNNENIMGMARANSYEDFIKTFEKVHFTRGIVSSKNRNDRLVKEILTNPNLKNFMVNYIAEHIYGEAN